MPSNAIIAPCMGCPPFLQCVLLMDSFLLYLTDIDECVLSPCGINADCQDTEGSFICTCNDGYTGDGIICLSNESRDFMSTYTL